MRRIIVFPAVLLASALALAGCVAGTGSSDQSIGTDQAPVAPSDPGVRTDGSEGGVAAEEGFAADDAAADRQVITNGYMTVTAVEPLDAATEAVRIVESIGGRIDGRTEYAPIDGDKGSAMLTLRIPADELTRTLDKLKELGETEEVSINSSDVTMESQDLDARINALSASVDRLLALLATASDTDVLIQLETAISDRQANLESLEAQRRYLSDQVSMSTITLNLISEADAPVDNPDTFWSGLQAGWEAFLGFFAGLLVALGVLLPWILLAAIVTVVVIVLIRRSRKAPAAPAVEATTAPATPAETGTGKITEPK